MKLVILAAIEAVGDYSVDDATELAVMLKDQCESLVGVSNGAVAVRFDVKDRLSLEALVTAARVGVEETLLEQADGDDIASYAVVKFVDGMTHRIRRES